MSILKKITTILFILCITGVSNAYPEAWGQINFSYISINDGLSQSTVFSIAQDKLGNMWFATYDGVNKYDGYTFTVYQHDENDPNSIANDISRIVMTDSKGRVWIGTRDGLSYYDEEKDKFQNFFLEKNGKHLQVNGIVELSPERLLISTLEGLTMFDIPASRFVDDIFGTAMHKMVASALYRHDDQIYIGTPSDGLYCYSIPKNTLEKLAYIPSSKQIQSILQQSPTRIWVATEGSGLLLVNPKTREVKTYRHSPSNPQSISSNYIRSLALDSQNRLWIGTFNDLNIYHEGNDSFMSYSSNPVESGSLSQRSVRSIFMDSQGGMWLGTYFGGLNYYHPIRNRFKNIEHIPFKNSLSDNVASCIVEDKQKNLWIGTNDGGLNLYIPGTQKFIHYALQESQREDGLGSNNIKSVYVDEPRGLVYIGAHAGGLSNNLMTEIPENSLKSPEGNYKNTHLLTVIDLRFNKLTKLSDDFRATTLPYLKNMDISYNCFSKFPTAPLNSSQLQAIGIRHQRDANGNRILREWPTGITTCPSLIQLQIGANDIRKVNETLTSQLYILDIKDNPNISIDVTSVCSQIRAGRYKLIYDKTQDIRGCDALDIKR